MVKAFTKSALALGLIAQALVNVSAQEVATNTTNTTQVSTTPSGSPEKDYADGVWMGAYYTQDNDHKSLLYLDQEVLQQASIVDELIDDARVNALKTIMDNVDVRYGGWRAADPSFPDKCRLYSIYNDAVCVYLFKLHGAENGRFLPFWIDKKVERLDAQCIDLTADKTYQAQGRLKSDFFDESAQAPDFLSLRIQGNAAVVLYETTDCSEQRYGITPYMDMTTGDVAWGETPLARFTWRFGHKTGVAKDLNKVDKIVPRLDRPAYDLGEDACVCPDEDGQYPPSEDGHYLTLWTALEQHGYLRADLEDGQKVGLIKRMMSDETSDEERYQLMEKYMGDAYHYPEASPYQLSEAEVKAEIRRQVYHSIVVDGPSNMAHPFPDPCDLKFTPAARRFRSMKIVTVFEPEAYDKDACGTSAAADAQSLMAALAEQAKNGMADQLDYEKMLQQQMADLEAEKAAQAEEENAVISNAIQTLNSGECKDSDICADIPASYIPSSCAETMRFLFKSMSNPPALPEAYMDYQLGSYCKVRCNACK